MRLKPAEHFNFKINFIHLYFYFNKKIIALNKNIDNKNFIGKGYKFKKKKIIKFYNNFCRPVVTGSPVVTGASTLISKQKKNAAK